METSARMSDHQQIVLGIDIWFALISEFQVLHGSSAYLTISNKKITRTWLANLATTAPPCVSLGGSHAIRAGGGGPRRLRTPDYNIIATSHPVLPASPVFPGNFWNKIFWDPVANPCFPLYQLRGEIVLWSYPDSFYWYKLTLALKNCT